MQLSSRPVALIVSYDGTSYQGLQAQKHTSRTIQGELESAVVRLGTHGDLNFVAAGRTDAGVHAAQQFIRVNISDRIPLPRVSVALNSLLPPDIRILKAAESNGFHPRFDAIQRRYVYRFSKERELLPVYRNMVTTIRMPFEQGLIKEAVTLFKGKHEFSAWRSSSCQGKRSLLTIDEAFAIEPDSPARFFEGSEVWQIVFAARSFLHHQVRFMVGGILSVASGKISLEELSRALERGERPNQVACTKPHGLMFLEARYPADKDPFSNEFN